MLHQRSSRIRSRRSSRDRDPWSFWRNVDVSSNLGKSVPFTIGINDDHMLEGLGVAELAFNDTAFTYMEFITSRYLAIFELTPDYTFSETPLTITRAYSTRQPGTAGTYFSATYIKNLSVTETR